MLYSSSSCGLKPLKSTSVLELTSLRQKLPHTTSQSCFHFIWVGSAGWMPLSRLLCVFTRSSREFSTSTSAFITSEKLCLFALSQFFRPPSPPSHHWFGSTKLMCRSSISFLDSQIDCFQLKSGHMHFLVSFPRWVSFSLKVIKVTLKTGIVFASPFPSVSLLQSLLERPLCVWKRW